MYTKLQTLLNRLVFKYYLDYYVVIIVFFFFFNKLRLISKITM